MFAGVKSKQPRAVAMNDGPGGQHLRVEFCTPRHQAMEDAAMPVGPIHHRGDGEAMIYHSVSTDIPAIFQSMLEIGPTILS
jgi:hypothetical protein